MSIYFFGPEPGRVISVHDSDMDDCTVRDRARRLIPHKHVVLVFGEDPANEIAGQMHTACDFQLKADGGWSEICDTVEAAPPTKGKGRTKARPKKT